LYFTNDEIVQLHLYVVRTFSQQSVDSSCNATKPSRTINWPSQTTPVSQAPQTPAMCLIVFSVASACSCPPAPAYPYLRLCPIARSQNPIKACPQGRRQSETLRYHGQCHWCRQCAREGGRQERRDYIRSRLGGQGRESLRREGVREEVARLERAREVESGDGGVWRDPEGHACPMVTLESPG
jgi:hypothetical protein